MNSIKRISKSLKYNQNGAVIKKKRGRKPKNVFSPEISPIRRSNRANVRKTSNVITIAIDDSDDEVQTITNETQEVVMEQSTQSNKENQSRSINGNNQESTANYSISNSNINEVVEIIESPHILIEHPHLSIPKSPVSIPITSVSVDDPPNDNVNSFSDCNPSTFDVPIYNNSSPKTLNLKHKKSQKNKKKNDETTPSVKTKLNEDTTSNNMDLDSLTCDINSNDLSITTINKLNDDINSSSSLPDLSSKSTSSIISSSQYFKDNNSLISNKWNTRQPKSILEIQLLNSEIDESFKDASASNLELLKSPSEFEISLIPSSKNHSNFIEENSIATNDNLIPPSNSTSIQSAAPNNNRELDFNINGTDHLSSDIYNEINVLLHDDFTIAIKGNDPMDICDDILTNSCDSNINTKTINKNNNTFRVTNAISSLFNKYKFKAKGKKLAFYCYNNKKFIVDNSNNSVYTINDEKINNEKIKATLNSLSNSINKSLNQFHANLLNIKSNKTIHRLPYRINMLAVTNKISTIPEEPSSDQLAPELKPTPLKTKSISEVNENNNVNITMNKNYSTANEKIQLIPIAEKKQSTSTEKEQLKIGKKVISTDAIDKENKSENINDRKRKRLESQSNKITSNKPIKDTSIKDTSKESTSVVNNHKNSNKLNNKDDKVTKQKKRINKTQNENNGEKQERRRGRPKKKRVLANGENNTDQINPKPNKENNSSKKNSLKNKNEEVKIKQENIFIKKENDTVTNKVREIIVIDLVDDDDDNNDKGNRNESIATTQNQNSVKKARVNKLSKEIVSSDNDDSESNLRLSLRKKNRKHSNKKEVKRRKLKMNKNNTVEKNEKSNKNKNKNTNENTKDEKINKNTNDERIEKIENKDKSEKTENKTTNEKIILTQNKDNDEEVNETQNIKKKVIDEKVKETKNNEKKCNDKKVKENKYIEKQTSDEKNKNDKINEEKNDAEKVNDTKMEESNVTDQKLIKINDTKSNNNNNIEKENDKKEETISNNLNSDLYFNDMDLDDDEQNIDMEDNCEKFIKNSIVPFNIKQLKSKTNNKNTYIKNEYEEDGDYEEDEEDDHHYQKRFHFNIKEKPRLFLGKEYKNYKVKVNNIELKEERDEIINDHKYSNNEKYRHLEKDICDDLKRKHISPKDLVGLAIENGFPDFFVQALKDGRSTSIEPKREIEESQTDSSPLIICLDDDLPLVSRKRREKKRKRKFSCIIEITDDENDDADIEDDNNSKGINNKRNKNKYKKISKNIPSILFPPSPSDTTNKNSPDSGNSISSLSSTSLNASVMNLKLTPPLRIERSFSNNDNKSYSKNTSSLPVSITNSVSNNNSNSNNNGNSNDNSNTDINTISSSNTSTNNSSKKRKTNNDIHKLDKKEKRDKNNGVTHKNDDDEDEASDVATSKLNNNKQTNYDSDESLDNYRNGFKNSISTNKYHPTFNYLNKRHPSWDSYFDTVNYNTKNSYYNYNINRHHHKRVPLYRYSQYPPPATHPSSTYMLMNRNKYHNPYAYKSNSMVNVNSYYSPNLSYNTILPTQSNYLYNVKPQSNLYNPFFYPPLSASPELGPPSTTLPSTLSSTSLSSNLNSSLLTTLPPLSSSLRNSLTPDSISTTLSSMNNSLNKNDISYLNSFDNSKFDLDINPLNLTLDENLKMLTKDINDLEKKEHEKNQDKKKTNKKNKDKNEITTSQPLMTTDVNIDDINKLLLNDIHIGNININDLSFENIGDFSIGKENSNSIDGLNKLTDVNLSGIDITPSTQKLVNESNMNNKILDFMSTPNMSSIKLQEILSTPNINNINAKLSELISSPNFDASKLAEMFNTSNPCTPKFMKNIEDSGIYLSTAAPLEEASSQTLVNDDQLAPNSQINKAEEVKDTSKKKSAKEKTKKRNKEKGKSKNKNKENETEKESKKTQGNNNDKNNDNKKNNKKENSTKGDKKDEKSTPTESDKINSEKQIIENLINTYITDPDACISDLNGKKNESKDNEHDTSTEGNNKEKLNENSHCSKEDETISKIENSSKNSILESTKSKDSKYTNTLSENLESKNIISKGSKSKDPKGDDSKPEDETEDLVKIDSSSKDSKKESLLFEEFIMDDLKEDGKSSEESKSKDSKSSDLNDSNKLVSKEIETEDNKPKSKLEATKNKIKEAMNEIMSQIIEVKESNDKQNITNQLLQSRNESIDKEKNKEEEENIINNKIDINDDNNNSGNSDKNEEKEEKEEMEYPEQYIFKQAVLNDDTFYYPYVGNFNDSSITEFNNPTIEKEEKKKEEELEKKKNINPMDMYNLMNERNGLNKEKQKSEENNHANGGAELMNKFYTEEERNKLNLMNVFPSLDSNDNLNTMNGTDLMNKFYTEEERNSLIKPFTENFGSQQENQSHDNMNGIELEKKLNKIDATDENNNNRNNNLYLDKENNCQNNQDNNDSKLDDSDFTSDSDSEEDTLLTNINGKELPINETPIGNDMNSMLELFPSIVRDVDVYCQPTLLEEKPIEENEYYCTKKNIMANPFSKDTAKAKENARNQEIVISDDEAKLVYRCHYPGCNKTFARLSYLLQHEFTHTGEMPYKCTKCDEKFFKKCDFKEHKKIHKLQARQAKLAAIEERKKNRI